MLLFRRIILESSCNHHRLKIVRDLKKASRFDPKQFYRCFSGLSPLQIAVVGSGPAGFYTADRILKTLKNVRVDLFEMQPAPFGLVRYGVAPDHPEVKQVIHKFQSVASDERCMFVGNVKIGEDLSVNDLKANYHAVILAYGADQDKLLGIEGENLKNVLGARVFVGWYNGLPAYRDISPNLSCTDVTIIGHGNVALDVARILLTPIDELRKTDITDYALQQLSQSKVKRVYIVGRRGPLHISFTTAELREMLRLPNCQFRVDSTEIQQDFEIAKQLVDQNRQKKRLMATLSEIIQRSHHSGPSDDDSMTKECYFKFLRSPLQILPDGSGVYASGVELGINRLTEGGEDAEAVTTNTSETIPSGLVVRSIGYRSLAVNGIPFDSKLGIVPNSFGRVLAQDGTQILGLYTSGWLKRGPSGVIATTMYDAFETADSILHDTSSHSSYFTQTRCGISGIRRLFRIRNKSYVAYQDWLKIDAAEKLRGQQEGKPREKIVVISEMLEVAQTTLAS